MLVFLLLNVIFLPVTIAFYGQQHMHPGIIILNVISDLVFLTDIILNFWTGVISQDNTVILNLKESRKLYAKKWLSLDMLSVFPFDYIFLIIIETLSLDSLTRASRALRLLKLIKFLSLLRLFRVVKMMHYLARWEEVCDSLPPSLPLSLSPSLAFLCEICMKYQRLPLFLSACCMSQSM